MHGQFSIGLPVAQRSASRGRLQHPEPPLTAQTASHEDAEFDLREDGLHQFRAGGSRQKIRSAYAGLGLAPAAQATVRPLAEQNKSVALARISANFQVLPSISGLRGMSGVSLAMELDHYNTRRAFHLDGLDEDSRQIQRPL